MSSVGNIVSLRLLFTLLPGHDSRDSCEGGGLTDPEDWLTSRNGIIANLVWGLRSLLHWPIGQSRMKIAKMISRGELDEYSK